MVPSEAGSELTHVHVFVLHFLHPLSSLSVRPGVGLLSRLSYRTEDVHPVTSAAKRGKKGPFRMPGVSASSTGVDRRKRLKDVSLNILVFPDGLHFFGLVCFCSDEHLN